MELSLPLWHDVASTPAPEAWQRAVQGAVAHRQPPLKLTGRAAQVLWQRQMTALDDIDGFIHESIYQPTPASAFGLPMIKAVARLKQALENQEIVTIWGDFDADGVTATAVLWEGLGQLFDPGQTLHYYIPNRLRESHGLSKAGLDQVRDWGTGLIVTCDTGSTNLEEVAYAQTLGMEVIITDHHTLPEVEPAAVALITPRHFPADHPLATLSGVAVAYKLLEGLHEALDPRPHYHLDHLLDLVAIGLIADLVNLTGDCRYLAQRGLKQLQTHLKENPPHLRPGVRELLTLCQKTGDRPTDISFGLGPRINAISRIHGDASFCVELLTSQDTDRCKTLAYEAELANTRRKGLQRDLYRQVMDRVAAIDLATTHCVILADEQWPTGILGLVAGQVSQALGRPTLLLTIDPPSPTGETPLARGSARSVPGLDLYDLFQAQAELLTSFGGHPLAAGLTLPVERLAMFTTAMNRAVREKLGSGVPQPILTIDLTVTVGDLGQDLFRELSLLEPYGMGNPAPRLLIRNAWFENTFHRNLRDATNQGVGFIKTEFDLWDDTVTAGFPGEWWGHYKEELPPGRCDVVVELDYHSATVSKQGLPRPGYYHVKLVDVRPTAENFSPIQPHLSHRSDPLASPESFPWPLATSTDSPIVVWQQLVGVAKYLARTQTTVERSRLLSRLGISEFSLGLGLQALTTAGFHITAAESLADAIEIAVALPQPMEDDALQHFLEAVAEEQFRQRYRLQQALIS